MQKASDIPRFSKVHGPYQLQLIRTCCEDAWCQFWYLLGKSCCNWKCLLYDPQTLKSSKRKPSYVSSVTWVLYILISQRKINNWAPIWTQNGTMYLEWENKNFTDWKPMDIHDDDDGGDDGDDGTFSGMCWESTVLRSGHQSTRVLSLEQPHEFSTVIFFILWIIKQSTAMLGGSPRCVQLVNGKGYSLNLIISNQEDKPLSRAGS